MRSFLCKVVIQAMLLQAFLMSAVSADAENPALSQSGNSDLEWKVVAGRLMLTREDIPAEAAPKSGLPPVAGPAKVQATTDTKTGKDTEVDAQVASASSNVIWYLEHGQPKAKIQEKPKLRKEGPLPADIPPSPQHRIKKTSFKYKRLKNEPLIEENFTEPADVEPEVKTPGFF